MNFLNHFKSDNKKRIRKFYNSKEWKRTRRHKMQMNPLCEYCEQLDRLTPAQDIDHITPLSKDFSKRLDYDNLQSLCRQCHIDKTIKDNNGNRHKAMNIINGLDQLTMELLNNEN